MLVVLKNKEEEEERKYKHSNVTNDTLKSRSPRPWWPVFRCRSMAGFEVSTEAQARAEGHGALTSNWRDPPI
jgi:hypothetical protein